MLTFRCIDMMVGQQKDSSNNVNRIFTHFTSGVA